MVAQQNKEVLTNTPVTKMTIKDLELELELLQTGVNIFEDAFKKTYADKVNPVQEVLDLYQGRIRDIENEIFERSILV